MSDDAFLINGFIYNSYKTSPEFEDGNNFYTQKHSKDQMDNLYGMSQKTVCNGGFCNTSQRMR